MKNRLSLLLLSLFIVTSMANAQLVVGSSDAMNSSETAVSSSLEVRYAPPTQRMMLRRYVMDTYGPLPIADAAITAGFNQYTNAPPEWHQGIEGYAKRFGSDFAIDTVATTTRYGLAELLREDTLYYRCECRGVFPRLGHAVFSTFTARSGQDGHRVFSIPALVSPYAGSMTAIYGWYPDRFGAEDGFRSGNYNLLAYIGGNVIQEFFHSGHRHVLTLAANKATNTDPSDGSKP